MSPGQTVTIYRDPLSELDPEGEARLVRYLGQDPYPYNGRRIQRWLVRFALDGIDEEADLPRTILAPPGPH